MKLLITQGTTPFAQRIAKRFGDERRIRYYFVSSDPIPDVLIRSGSYKEIPAANEATFVHELLKLALDRQVTHLLPLGMDEVLLLTDAKQLFIEYDIQILVPDRAALAGLEVMENPPRQLELVLLEKGLRITQNGQREEPPIDEALSGVFCISDEDIPYLCLINSNS